MVKVGGSNPRAESPSWIPGLFLKSGKTRCLPCHPFLVPGQVKGNVGTSTASPGSYMTGQGELTLFYVLIRIRHMKREKQAEIDR